jgi:hypothetical protein
LAVAEQVVLCLNLRANQAELVTFLVLVLWLGLVVQQEMVYVDNLASVEAMSETVVAQGAEDRQRLAALGVIQATEATGGFTMLSEPKTYRQEAPEQAQALLLVILYQAVAVVLVYTGRPLLLQLQVKEAVVAQLEVLSTMEYQHPM